MRIRPVRKAMPCRFYYIGIKKWCTPVGIFELLILSHLSTDVSEPWNHEYLLRPHASTEKKKIFFVFSNHIDDFSAFRADDQVDEIIYYHFVCVCPPVYFKCQSTH